MYNHQGIYSGRVKIENEKKERKFDFSTCRNNESFLQAENSAETPGLAQRLCPFRAAHDWKYKGFNLRPTYFQVLNDELGFAC